MKLEYDKSRISYPILVGIIANRNKSRLNYLDIMKHVLSQDYGIKVAVEYLKPIKGPDFDDDEDTPKLTNAADEVIPFCDDIIIDTGTYNYLKGVDLSLPKYDKSCTLSNGTNTSLRSLHKTQLWTYKVANLLYKITEKVDKDFYESFVIGPSGTNFKKAWDLFMTWKRYTLRHQTIEYNREAFIEKLKNVYTLDEKNFAVYLSKVEKHHQALILGQEILQAMNLQDVADEDFPVKIKNEEFDMRITQYLNTLTDAKLATMVDIFDLTDKTYTSLEVVKESKTKRTNFAKMILSYAFGITCEGANCKRKKELSNNIFNESLAKYKVNKKQLPLQNNTNDYAFIQFSDYI